MKVSFFKCFEYIFFLIFKCACQSESTLPDRTNKQNPRALGTILIANKGGQRIKKSKTLTHTMVAY